MGALHAGHLSLLETGKKYGRSLIATIFVNPTQFGPDEDFSQYPRTEDKDIEMLDRAGCHAVFLPAEAEMYPEGPNAEIKADIKLSSVLDGGFRKGHFDGVVTVVSRLFTMVRPNTAVFGEKDFQQLRIVTEMAREFHPSISIVGSPLVRDKNGLALSSRNRFLTKEEEEKALRLSRGIQMARNLVSSGEKQCSKIIAAVQETIFPSTFGESTENMIADYISVNDANTLQPIQTVSKESRIFLAVRVGKTRLIDNAQLN